VSFNLWKAIRVPFDAVSYGYRELRKALFTAPRPSGTYVVVAGTVDEVEAALGRESYAPNWEFSYHERGEDLNLARIEYEPREIHDHEYVWWQAHVRGWRQSEESIRLRPHYELEPTEYDQDHIDGIGLDVTRGVERVAEALNAEGLHYERYENLPPGGEG